MPVKSMGASKLCLGSFFLATGMEMPERRQGYGC